MADMSKFSPDGGPTIFDLKDRFVRPHIERLVKDTVGWTGKNDFNPVNTSTNRAVVTPIADGIHVVSSISGNWANGGFIVKNPKKNSDYVASCNIDYISGKSSVTIKTASSITDLEGDPIAGDFDNSADKESIINFNTGNSDYLYIQFCVTNGNGGTGEANFTYIMLRSAEYTDPTYESYHDSVEVTFEEELHGVNLFDIDAATQEINDVTFTVNNDGSVKVNGTASALTVFEMNLNRKPILDIGQYIMSGCPKTGSRDHYYMSMQERNAGDNGWIDPVYEDTGNGCIVKRTTNNKISFTIVVKSGEALSNVMFYPMLRKADIDDPTYRPYNPQAIQNQLNAETGVLGAKNLLPVKFGISGSKNGINYTIDLDGVVTCNGTASVNTEFDMTDPGTWLEKGKYIQSVKVSGSISGGSVNWHTSAVHNGVWLRNIVDNRIADGEFSLDFVVDYDGYEQLSNGMWFKSGVTVTNLKVYPMIRLASDPDDTFVPHVMTNRELTTDKAEVSAIATNESGRTTASKAYAIGEHFYKDGKFCTVTAAIASGETLTKNTNYVENRVDNFFQKYIGNPVASRSIANGAIGDTLSIKIKSYHGAIIVACKFGASVPNDDNFIIAFAGGQGGVAYIRTPLLKSETQSFTLAASNTDDYTTITMTLTEAGYYSLHAFLLPIFYANGYDQFPYS